MRTRFWLRSSFALALALSAGFACLGTASGQPEPAKQTSKRHDANNQSALSESMEAVVLGSQKFVAKDVEGAMLSFQKAVKLQPRNALALYALGEGFMSQGKAQEAEAPLTTADDAAPQGSPVKPRIVFVLASCKERLHKWDEARELWRRYLELAQTKPAATVFPQSAAERARMVDEWAKLDAAYATVRSRIGSAGAAAAGAAPSAPASSPATAPDGGK